MLFRKLGVTIPRYYRCFSVKTLNGQNFKSFIMPKDMKHHIKSIQKERNRIKRNSIKYTPTFAYFQVIGQGTRGEPRCVFLCTDHWNYIFNCGEGTQRLAIEHHAKLTKTENVFITRPTWNNIGGLPGVVLTIQEIGIDTLHLHGPVNSIEVIEATENFMNITELTVKPISNTQPFKDQAITVNYIVMQKPNNRVTEEEDESVLESVKINFYDYQKIYKKRPHSPLPLGKPVKKKSSEVDELVAFVCKLEEKLGTLDVHKCIELNVPAGPLLGKLKAGEDVTLENGKVIKSEDVVGETDKGPLFIVLECPDEEWMDLIVNNKAFTKYQNAKEDEEPVSCIVHFAPDKILQNPIYKQWMHKFGPDTHHLIINEANTGYSSEGAYKMQHQLHLIHPTIFPFFKNEKLFPEYQFRSRYSLNLDDIEKLESTSSSNVEETVENKDLDPVYLKENLKVRRCKTLDMFHLRPRKGLNTEKNVKINPNLYIQETMEIDGFLDSLADLQTEINARTKALGNNLEEFPKVLMLGTGSSVPNKVRNTSAILFRIDEDRSVLMDCGESTINQIIKFYGETEADKVLNTIKCVYISHLHADHHLGLIGLLENRMNISNDPIFLLAPAQIIGYLRYYNNNLNRIFDNFTLISNRDIIMDRTVLPPEKLKNLLDSLNISNVETCFVKHCPFSYGVAFTLKDGRKICYSGDTMPCEKFTQLARNSFLLIHEATMEDALENDAILKCHSTISQAIHTGFLADVNFTLLTHFSQRYCKLPLLTDSQKSGHDYSHVGIAYDFMDISLSKLSLLPLFYKTLTVLFSDFRESLFQKAIKRNFKKQIADQNS